MVCSTPTVVSSPGKVLIAGGYLVLEPAYSGLVIATSSRFYTVVREESEGSASTTRSPCSIAVNSPQFSDPAWRYSITYSDSDLTSCRVEQIREPSSSPNKFVHLALEAAVKVACAKGAVADTSLRIDILGDNDFYSQERKASGPDCASAVDEAEQFAYLKTSLKDVHKTGLGSSAAMVTSLVAGVFLHLTGHHSGNTDVALSDDTLRLIHNTAQYAHSQAQGKVGSGFDVSSAVWGSQVYARFSPECLAALLEEPDVRPSALLEGLSPASKLWQPGSPTAGGVQPFSLPPLTTLLLADVDAGSNTPSMVGKVLQWKKSRPQEAEQLYAEIARANSQLAAIFEKLQALSEADAHAYKTAIADLSDRPSSQWEASDSDVARSLLEVKNAVTMIRGSMKSMGEAAGVPIEPDEQTQLLDACTERCSGVLGGGVPGAGGYDALWVLALAPDASPSPGEKQVRFLWQDWTEMSVKPLSQKARIFNDGSADASSGASGLQTHRLEDIPGMEQALQREK